MEFQEGLSSKNHPAPIAYKIIEEYFSYYTFIIPILKPGPTHLSDILPRLKHFNYQVHFACSLSD